MRSIITAIAACVFLLVTSGCEDEPVNTIAVDFDPPTRSVSADRTGAFTFDDSVFLEPEFNLSPSNIVEAEWSVTQVTGYVVDLDGDGEADTELPDPSSVSFTSASYLEATASFIYQGDYIIQLEVTDDIGRVGRGQVKVIVGDGISDDQHLPIAPVAGDG